MSTSSASSSISNTLSLVAAFDDLNRLNNVLNDGYGEECFLRFARQQEWCRMQWASALGETVRLQHELDDALRALTTWEAKFANARKLLDSEKKQRRLAVEKCEALEKQMALARDLLFNDNRNKLNNETLEKLAFLNATARSTVGEQNQQGAKLNAIPEMNSTGTVLSDVSYSRSEDDLDLSIVSGRRSWVKTRNSLARSPHGTSPGQQDHVSTVKKRRSSSSSATKVVEIEGAGRVLATATTTLTLERAVPGDGNNKPPSFGRDAISESSDEQQTPQSQIGRCVVQSKQTLRSQVSDYPPSAPPRTDTESASDMNSPRKQLTTRPSLRQEPWGSPRARLRAHSFVNKTYFCAETCRPCGKKIKFAKIGSRCETCRATCHAECRNLLPLPCVPPGTATHNQNTQGSIADYAPSTPPMVPALLVHCINEVEKRGLSEQGLYRKSGSDKDVKRLKEKFLRNHGSPPLADEDVHTLCSCIKDFIRGLSEPLVTRSLWNDFMEAALISEPGDAAAALIQAISQLPQPNRDTVAFLVLHLQKVAESPDCQMPIGNLSKVFGPTVLNYADAPEKDMYKLTANQLLVMELILRLPSEYWVQFVGAGELCPSPYMTPQGTPLATPGTNNRNDGLRSRGYFYSPVQTAITRKPKKYFA